MGPVGVGGNLLLRICNSSQPYRINRLTSYTPTIIRRYSHSDEKGYKDNGAEEKQHSERKEREGHIREGPTARAPSTAEEFERVAEEKTRQAFASQTLKDGLQEGNMAKSTSDSVEERFKKPPGVAGELPQDRQQ